MTHLKIEQNNILENVSSAVIEALYNLAISGDLDLTSNLAGNIHVTATYQEYIDTITAKYSDLTIIADKQYIRLIDSEITRALSVSYGDGTGITHESYMLARESVTNVTQLKANASAIETTEDLTLFPYITSFPGAWFINSTNLKILDLSNITSISNSLCNGCTSVVQIKNANNVETILTEAFRECNNLAGVLDFPNLITLSGSRHFLRCSKVTGFVAPKITNINERTFEGCTNLTGNLVFKKVTSIGGAAFLGCKSELWIFLEDIQTFSYNLFANASSNINLIINNTTVPTVEGNTFDTKVNIYVPNSAVTTYRSTLTQYSSQLNKIKSIDELPADKLAIVNES